MRISLKSDYAVRAMAQLSAEVEGPVKGETLARLQGIPLKFLLGIMNDLRLAHLVRSQRGPEGGYTLRRPPGEITLADVIRAVDGPLANVHDTSLEDLEYPGPTRALKDVWMAVRASLRSVLETVTLEHLIAGELPEEVQSLVDRYRLWATEQGPYRGVAAEPPARPRRARGIPRSRGAPSRRS